MDVDHHRRDRCEKMGTWLLGYRLVVKQMPEVEEVADHATSSEDKNDCSDNQELLAFHGGVYMYVIVIDVMC